MAIAMASAASSGLGISSNPHSTFTFCCTCFLSAFPYPVMTSFTCNGVNSVNGILFCSSVKSTTPLASPTEMAVFALLQKRSV